MTRAEKTLALRTSVLGVLLTCLVIAIDSAGMLESLEHWLYDRRARDCQFFTPKSTDQLALIDIDDQALLSIGSWPWPRGRIAQMIDEIAAAKAKVVGFDVIFSEPQATMYLVDDLPDGKYDVRGKINNDADLARAVQKFPTIMPAAFDIKSDPNAPVYKVVQDAAPPDPTLAAQRDSALHALVREALMKDLEQKIDDLTAKLRASGVQNPNLDQQVAQDYAMALREAAYERISREMSLWRAAVKGPAPAVDELVTHLLPHSHFMDSSLIRLIRSEYQRWLAQDALKCFARPRAPTVPPLLNAENVLAPIAPLSAVTASTGFVNYLPNQDGVVRSMPLWVSYQNGIYPQAGLSLACAMLGIDPRDPSAVRIADDNITLLAPAGRSIRIPVRTIHSRNLGSYGTFMDIPWIGSSNWLSMFPRDRVPHISADELWQAALTRQSIVANRAEVHDAMQFCCVKVLGMDETLQQFEQLPPEDSPARQKMIGQVLAELESSGFLRPISPEMQKTDYYRRFTDVVGVLRHAGEAEAALRATLASQETDLAKLLSNKAVLFGWTATAAAGSDFVPTPLHSRCPGVMVHAAIFNAIMTGELWRSLPQWTNYAIALAMGLLTTAAVAFLSPWKAVAATGAMMVSWFVFNGIVMFDYLNISANFAGASVLAAGALAWAGCTLTRLLIEGLERRRITLKFRAYNDPGFVDYIVEHPEQEEQLLKGQNRELTICFTDLAGYTSLSEKLGVSVLVKVIREYLTEMVPLIHTYGGHVDKFAGDGIMFFFGALRPDRPHHAQDAIATILDMQLALKPFNQRLADQNLPQVGMRAGIATGIVLSGDVGSENRANYTVIGDDVNLAARLESANKATGTRNLLTQATVDLLNGTYLLRPVGRLQVVGKESNVMTYEAISAAATATDAQKHWVALTSEMVQSYQAGDLDACAAAIEKLEAEFGPDKLVALYRSMCQLHRSSPREKWEGKIVLAEK